jgi:hypothetical protein
MTLRFLQAALALSGVCAVPCALWAQAPVVSSSSASLTPTNDRIIANVPAKVDAVEAMTAWEKKSLFSRTARVGGADELRSALREARPGSRIVVGPGTYAGGFYASNLRGRPEQPIVLEAADAQNSPVLQGGMHIGSASFLVVRGLTFEKAPNGLNIDDGGPENFLPKPARAILVENVSVRDIGPEGNTDGIKLSGLREFVVRNCRVERWGSAGQGIDMVGCHSGIVEGNFLQAREKSGSTGIQAKGGCRNLAIRANRLVESGPRGIMCGGSTGLAFFRPPLAAKEQWPRGEFHEASGILIEHNTLEGHDAPVAFVNVDGAIFRFNTLVRPRAWALRILQETNDTGFVPARNVRFEDNLVVFSRSWRENGVNIGPGTSPESFAFARNWWFAEDDASQKPRLPSPEKDGVLGTDPQLEQAGPGIWKVKNPQAQRFGAQVLAPPQRKPDGQH